MRRALALAVACASLAAVFAVAPVGAAERPITFQGNLGSSCLFGTAPARHSLVVTAKTPSGDLRSLTGVETDANGRWFTCGTFDTPLNSGASVIGKYRTKRRTLTLPVLSL